MYYILRNVLYYILLLYFTQYYSFSEHGCGVGAQVSRPPPPHSGGLPGMSNYSLAILVTSSQFQADILQQTVAVIDDLNLNSSLLRAPRAGHNVDVRFFDTCPGPGFSFKEVRTPCIPSTYPVHTKHVPRAYQVRTPCIPSTYLVLGTGYVGPVLSLVLSCRVGAAPLRRFPLLSVQIAKKNLS